MLFFKKTPHPWQEVLHLIPLPLSGEGHIIFLSFVRRGPNYILLPLREGEGEGGQIYRKEREMSNLSVGSIVRCRNREWVILPSPGENLLLLRPLTESDREVSFIMFVNCHNVVFLVY